MYTENAPIVILKGNQSDILPEIKLIIFNEIIKILFSLKEEKQKCSELIVSYSKKALLIKLTFTDENDDLLMALIKKVSKDFNQAITLVHGKIIVSKSKDGINVWKLKVPIK